MKKLKRIVVKIGSNVLAKTNEGLDLQKVNSDFGKQYIDELLKGSKKWEVQEKLVQKDFKLVLTREGKLFADGIAADLFF